MKRKLALLLALVFALTVLCGCGGSRKELLEELNEKYDSLGALLYDTVYATSLCGALSENDELSDSIAQMKTQIKALGSKVSAQSTLTPASLEAIINSLNTVIEKLNGIKDEYTMTEEEEDALAVELKIQADIEAEEARLEAIAEAQAEAAAAAAEEAAETEEEA